MDINPQRVRSAEFSTARKGLDPDEVRDFLGQVADELERAQNQATAMEARARAAVARLQQLSDNTDVSGEVAAPSGIVANETPDETTTAPTEVVPVVAAATPAPVESIVASVDESETISRTMLLAQRAADLTIAEAEAEAARMRSEADDAATTLVDKAKAEARAAGESERAVVESEVNSLMARRDFLESDVDHMEQFLVDQRTRLREAATAMIDIAERVPGGLGEVRRPVLSASDDTTDTGEPQDATMPYERPLDDGDADADAGQSSAADAASDSTDDAPQVEQPPVMRLGFNDD